MGDHNGGVSTSSTMRAAQHQRGMPQTPPTTRPKIKIIHIIAPEIMKTDVAHFRDLVQRLTGKPAARAGTADVASTTRTPVEEEEEETTNKKRLRPAPAPAPVADDERSNDDYKVQEPVTKKRKIKCEVKVEEGSFGDYDLDRSDLWMDLNPGGFLSFLEEEGVFQGLAADDHDFLQPAFASSRMDLVGEMFAPA